MTSPWYKIVTPREDLREGRPLDASEFAVHLDQVRDGCAPSVYQDPGEFFERTFLTKNLSTLAVEVIRRLNGIKVQTSPIFNLSTQFGGGKTHALTTLYHLATGSSGASWKGVDGLLSQAEISSMPSAAVGVFVGTEFDSLVGRGGDDGTPVRKTPWGELAWQLGGAEALGLVAEHERTATAPGGDVLAKLLPAERPALILFDELMNYVSRSRKSGLGAQLYTFLHVLSEVARSRDRVVLAVSIPASEMEMNAEDQADYERFKKLLDRLGKAVIMSAETETSEIIRRRLFEWKGLPEAAQETIDSYSEWAVEHRHQLPSWFAIERASSAFSATYPFHPSVLSVFERKWRALPRFQQTRGVLRLLALWVSRAYVDGFQGAHADPLITLGTAPLDDSMFRAAVFEQLGEHRLEAAITTDIAGKEHAHSLRLDKSASEPVRRARLHRRVATSILFESNGGQQRGEATLPEVRLAVGEPQLDIGNVEQSLETLVDTCYYLRSEKNRFKFSFQPNLNKLLADRRASVPGSAIKERVHNEVRSVFGASRRQVEYVFFPEHSSQIPDRSVLTMVIIEPDYEVDETGLRARIEEFSKAYGSTSRTYKSALIWCGPDGASTLAEEARKLLAWTDIESEGLQLDEPQRRQLSENLARAKRDLREAVWRSYKNVFLLDQGNAVRRIDLGLVHSSAADSLASLILGRLRQEDVVVDGISPNFLVRNWPPALPEWSTKGVRDAFFSSPTFPRLSDAEAVRQTIVRGVEAGAFAYAGKQNEGRYEPFLFETSLQAADVEIAADVYLLRREDAGAYRDRLESASRGSTPPKGASPDTTPTPIAEENYDPATAGDQPATVRERAGVSGKALTGFQWTGTITPQKWMNFYTKILATYATSGGLELILTCSINPPGGVSEQRLQETQRALRDLGLDESVARLENDNEEAD